jgi:hypothetical protein
MVKKITTNSFVERAIAVHGARYNYAQTQYESAQGKIEIGCPEHGAFVQAAYSHLNGRGCPQCAKRVQSSKRTYTVEEFIARARTVHGTRYSYDRAVYTKKGQPLLVTCPEHGDFPVAPNNHIVRKSGCPQCAAVSRSVKQKGRRRPGIGGRPAWSREQFITAANEVHTGKYRYDSLVYENVNTHVTVTCPKHGDFIQFGSAHLAGQGCPSCPAVISSGHMQISEFLTTLGVEHRNNDRTMIRPYEIDIVIPSLNLAIEYCGLYWHSEKKLGTNYHLDKHLACERVGLRLITIFEDEWKQRRHAIEDTLRHMVGHSRPGEYARKCVIREIDWKQAEVLLEAQHLLGSGKPGRHHVGAFAPDGTLVGVMTFGTPSDERGQTELVEMKRFVTDGRNHPGLGSRMFKWAVHEYGFIRVCAFVDRRWFTGSFKSISGFEIAGETPPTLYWTDFKLRYKRRFRTKAQLLEMEQFAGSNRSKASMMNELGYFRIWDCGKLRLIWERPGAEHLR